MEVIVNGRKLATPAGNPLKVPTQALADAIAQEYLACHPALAAGSPRNGTGTPQQVRGDSRKMPLTALAYTAIDRIAGQRGDIIEVLLVYVDTDTLSYRASGSQLLAKQQQAEWDPVLDWLGKTMGTTWQVTSGVMPIDQPPELHRAVGKYLAGLSDMELAAACVLSSGCSSLVLMLAVVAGHIEAQEAFRLSRLEEEYQAQAWGRDMEAEARAARLKQEILDAGRFLDLLRA